MISLDLKLLEVSKTGRNKNSGGLTYERIYFTEARQKLATILERASKDGGVQIKRRDGQSFVLKSIKTTKSPLDVPGVDLGLSSKDIVAIVREMREQN